MSPRRLAINLYQLARKARFDVDALRVSNVESGLWLDEEVYDAVNTAVDRAYKILRLAESDIVTTTVESDDATIDKGTEVYNPSSLRLADATSDYTLPPDFVRVVSIRCITAGFEGIKFFPALSRERRYIDARNIPDSDLISARDSEHNFYYTVIGARTLRITPIPQDTIDIELIYQYRPRRLLVYTTGTVDVTPTSAAVTGSSTLWLSAGLQAPSDLIISATPDVVDLGTLYPQILSFQTDTTLTLARAWTGANNDTAAYGIAMIPLLPEEHHAWLAQLAGAIMLRKVNPELSTQSQAELTKQLVEEVMPEVALRQLHESLPVEAFDLP